MPGSPSLPFWGLIPVKVQGPRLRQTAPPILGFCYNWKARLAREPPTLSQVPGVSTTTGSSIAPAELWRKSSSTGQRPYSGGEATLQGGAGLQLSAPFGEPSTQGLFFHFSGESDPG